MPIKLILTILLIILVTVFTGFNLENKCDIWLFFHTFKNVPAYAMIVGSFAAGVLLTIPFAFFHRSKSKGESESAEKKKHFPSGKKNPPGDINAEPPAMVEQ